MKSLRLSLSLLLSAAAFAGSARADVKLPAILSDHMVLQRDVAVPIWGWAEPGEEVTVTIGKQTKTTKADAKGKWMVKLDKLKAGDGLTLEVKGKNTLTVKDVLVGEVWLGSGQSNMAFTVARGKDYEQEKAAANFPQIRMFTCGSHTSPTVQEDCVGSWEVCTPDTVSKFSAALYFFGRELHQTLQVPVGLVHSSVGGTPIESWISPEAQEKSAELKPFFETVVKEPAPAGEPAPKQVKGGKKAAAGKAQDPAAVAARKSNIGGLFNGKIAPLIPYAIRGAIWYQGEANSVPAKAPYYQYQLPLLVQDWRARWGYDFFFAWVQLPNFEGLGRDWPTVREAMLKSLSVKDTGMAITIDLGEAKNIHPTNKQDVGKRLSMWALGTVYGKKVATSGPLPAGHKVKGASVELSFSHTDGGLVAKGGDVKGFVVAGADKQWKPAQARIEKDKVIVSSAEVKEPVAVRYAWENWPDCNLYNGAGIPASPFRTDDWK